MSQDSTPKKILRGAAITPLKVFSTSASALHSSRSASVILDILSPVASTTMMMGSEQELVGRRASVDAAMKFCQQRVVDLA